MKNLLFAIALVLSAAIYAQERNEKTYPFVRVFDQQSQKIHKGKIISVDDTTLFLKRQKGSVGISYSEIGVIKTKRSAGNNVLMGTAIGGASIGILGAAAGLGSDSYITTADGAGWGAILGATAGAVIGTATIPFKKSETYIINGDINKWNVFRQSILKFKNDYQNEELNSTPPIL